MAPFRFPCSSCSGCEPCRHKSQLAIKNLELQEAARASAAGQCKFRLTLDHLASSIAGLGHQLALAAADAAAVCVCVCERERALWPLANTLTVSTMISACVYQRAGSLVISATTTMCDKEDIDVLCAMHTHTHEQTHTQTQTRTHTLTQHVNYNV
jgi:hypothetical protein